MRRSNCVFFALALYWRRRMRGYLTFRRSRWGPFPHVLYGELRKSGLVHVVSYVPTDPRHKKLPPPLFRGRVKWGDAP